MVVSKYLTRRVAMALGLAAALLLGCAYRVRAAALETAVLVVSPKGGVFATNVTVTLSAIAKEIRYTTDGSEPVANSLLYSAPLLLTNSVWLKARAFPP